MMSDERHVLAARKIRYVMLGLVLAATLAAYVFNFGNTFVDWDLRAYQNVLTSTDYWNTTVKLFTDFHGKVVPGYYAPLSSVSMMLDKALVGSEEPLPRLTLVINLLFHCCNGILVFILIRWLGGRVDVALVTAAIFLLHPVQVPSIAWFAQRKAVLAGTLYLGGFIAYVKYARAAAFRNYFASLVLFVLAMLTKPTVAVFPLALWVTVLWPPWSQGTVRQVLPTDHVSSGCEVTPKLSFLGLVGNRLSTLPALLPLFAISLAFGLIIIESEGVGTETYVPDMPALDRLLVAATSLWFYVQKVLVPVSLSPLYPQWGVDPWSPLWWLPLLATIGALIAGVVFRQRIGNLGVWGILNFLIPLIPVSTLFKFGYLRLAFVSDHFLYLSMVGIAACIAVAADAVWRRVSGVVRYVWGAVVVAYLVFLTYQTVGYVKVWENSETLWSHCIQYAPENWMGHNYLGHALLDSGKLSDAAKSFKKTIDLKERYVHERLSRARDLAMSGDLRRAEREQAKAEDVKRSLAMAFHNLGNAYLYAAMPLEAKEQYGKAVHLSANSPDLVKYLTNLGVACTDLKQYSEAIAHLNLAVELSPHLFEANYSLGYALELAGKKELADLYFGRAQAIRPWVPRPEISKKGE